MLHVLARDGFEDQPTIRPVTKKNALSMIKLGAPITVVTRAYLPPARSAHEDNRSFAVLMPDCGAPEDAYFLKAQVHDAGTGDRTRFTASVTLEDNAVTCALLQPENIVGPLPAYLACLAALDVGLDAFEALVIEVDRAQDARKDWISDQDRHVLNALLDHKEQVLSQLESTLTRLCKKAQDEDSDLAKRHAARTALWAQVKPGTFLVALRTNGDHLAAQLARKVAPIGLDEHHSYVVLQPDHLASVHENLKTLYGIAARELAVTDERALLARLTAEAEKNARSYPELCTPYIRGPREFKGIADPTLPFDFSHSYRHHSFRVPPADWKADGTPRPNTQGHVWQIGGAYGDRGIPALQLPGQDDTHRLRVVRVSKRRGPWALGFVEDRQFGRHLVASDRFMDCLPPDALVPPSDTVDRPELPDGLTYLDLPRVASGLRFDPEFLSYRRRADLLQINPFHPDAEATDQYSWRTQASGDATPNDALVLDAPRDLPQIWRARDFGRDGLDYIMLSDTLMQVLTARGVMAHIPAARIGIAAP